MVCAIPLEIGVEDFLLEVSQLCVAEVVLGDGDELRGLCANGEFE